MKHIMAFLMAGVLCVACTGNKVYDHYNHTPIAGWEKIDTLKFEVPPLAKQGLYATSMGLRINNAFPFISMTLIVEQTVLPANKTVIDTINCPLMGKDGQVRGKGVSYYQYHFPVSLMQLNENDSLHITVRHDMKREILPGVSDIGIELERRQ
ncbi:MULTISPECIES: gliding motility lipoprotein GldH [Hallella]|uniref:Gliding motility lipoprotein GldH n=1 Tax=Hallella faecis TaxID=2841596 RepID=A0ABV1FPJ2_9BACT|nr:MULTISPECIES: gliding motility lipoprotein GldH [Hallella]MCI7434529.1 gliding motility lipoprotein GldH [Prevotella sp.]MBU0289491.1 gliding motility lipoprotein GldH [Hallella faecis]MDD7045784.1 gliding motility lipoprotein GldH [Prevotella sp.]MDR3845528.1 gliding motility lipoprotein GldH [Hallella sp.]MDY5925476.1 gliding motility lipoprotein GldH [Hallella sp.]